MSTHNSFALCLGGDGLDLGCFVGLEFFGRPLPAFIIGIRGDGKHGQIRRLGS